MSETILGADIGLALEDQFTSCAETNAKGHHANVVDGLFAIARALESVAYQLKCLRTDDAEMENGQ